MPLLTCPRCGADTPPPRPRSDDPARCRSCGHEFAADLGRGGPPRWLVVLLAVLGVAAIAGFVGYMVYEQLKDQDEADVGDDVAPPVLNPNPPVNPLPRGKGPRADADPGLFPFGPPAKAPDPQAVTADLKARLVGGWVSRPGRKVIGAPLRRVTYAADGTFTDARRGHPELTGKWEAVTSHGTNVLVLARSEGRSPLRVTFNGPDEIDHDDDEAGAADTLIRVNR